MSKIISAIKKDNVVKAIHKFVEAYDSDIEIYLVGGVVRDFYLGFENFDKDLVVKNVDVKEFSRALADELNASFVPLDEDNKIYRIVLEDKINYIDVAALVGGSIEEDLKRRDLTINSIAYDLLNEKIIDINNGISDLENKIIRHILEQNFLDDPLRLLRAYRFSANLGFELDKDLVSIIKKHFKLIKIPAVERVTYELIKLFGGKYSHKTLFQMDEAGLLTELFSISEELKQVPPNLHHHLNLFEHSIETVNQVQMLYDTASKEVKGHLEKVDFGGQSRLAYLKFSAYLHDIGKPQTWTIEESTGRHRFIKHDDVGAKLSVSILKRLKFSKKTIDYVQKMIKFHIYPSHVVAAPDINEKIYMRFIRKMEDESIDVILLAMADRLSARGVEITEEIVDKNIRALQSLLDYYLSIKDSLEPLPKLLSGEDIMTLLKIGPSRELGEVIKSLKEAQISGEVCSKDEAIAFVTTLARVVV